MIKYAVMTFLFEPFWQDGRTTHEQMIADFKRLGMDGVEVFQTFFVADPGLIPRYQKALADNGMELPVIDIICDLVYSNAQEKKKGADDLKRGIEICGALGAKVALVAGHAPKEGIKLADGRKMIADGLAAQAGLAKQNGVTLAVEDFGFTPTLLCKGADCLQVVELSKGAVKMVFDTGNFEFAGEHADANFERCYPHVCHVHFKDWRTRATHQPEDTDIGKELFWAPLGSGIVPNAKVGKLLKQRGYSGWVSLEPGAVGGGPAATVARDLPVLKQWIN